MAIASLFLSATAMLAYSIPDSGSEYMRVLNATLLFMAGWNLSAFFYAIVHGN